MKTFTDERSLWLREAARQRDDAAHAHRQAAVCEGQGRPESAERYRHVARHHEEWVPVPFASSRASSPMTWRGA